VYSVCDVILCIDGKNCLSIFKTLNIQRRSKYLLLQLFAYIKLYVVNKKYQAYKHKIHAFYRVNCADCKVFKSVIKELPNNL
jgi:hypothetical protein